MGQRRNPPLRSCFVDATEKLFFLFIPPYPRTPRFFILPLLKGALSAISRGLGRERDEEEGKEGGDYPLSVFLTG